MPQRPAGPPPARPPPCTCHGRPAITLSSLLSPSSFPSWSHSRSGAAQLNGDTATSTRGTASTSTRGRPDWCAPTRDGAGAATARWPASDAGRRRGERAETSTRSTRSTPRGPAHFKAEAPAAGAAAKAVGAKRLAANRGKHQEDRAAVGPAASKTRRGGAPSRGWPNDA